MQSWIAKGRHSPTDLGKRKAQKMYKATEAATVAVRKSFYISMLLTVLKRLLNFQLVNGFTFVIVNGLMHNTCVPDALYSPSSSI